jgi:hypothetical protein
MNGPLVEKYPDMIHQRDERQLLPFQVAIISKMEEPALKLIELYVLITSFYES